MDPVIRHTKWEALVVSTPAQDSGQSMWNKTLVIIIPPPFHNDPVASM